MFRGVSPLIAPRTKLVPRLKLKLLIPLLGWILSKFYVEKAFSEEAKGFGDRIVSDIKVQFIKKLRGAEWMSKSVRNLGIEKGECPLLI